MNVPSCIQPYREKLRITNQLHLKQDAFQWNFKHSALHTEGWWGILRQSSDQHVHQPCRPLSGFRQRYGVPESSSAQFSLRHSLIQLHPWNPTPHLLIQSAHSRNPWHRFCFPHSELLVHHLALSSGFWPRAAFWPEHWLALSGSAASSTLALTRFRAWPGDLIPGRQNWKGKMQHSDATSSLFIQLWKWLDSAFGEQIYWSRAKRNACANDDQDHKMDGTLQKRLMEQSKVHHKATSCYFYY